MKLPNLPTNRRQSRYRAETVLGKTLPPTAHVHHHSLTELVICENQKYHELITVRERAFYACGDPHKRKCYLCGVYDEIKNLSSTTVKNTYKSLVTKFYHPTCNQIRGRRYYWESIARLFKTEKCSTCCWCWDVPGQAVYCRLAPMIDPESCEGPREE